MAANKISPLGLGSRLCIVRYQAGYGKNVPDIPSPGLSQPVLFQLFPGKAAQPWTQGGSVVLSCQAPHPQPSRPVLRLTVHSTCLKQQGLSPFLWSALTNPPLRFLPIAMLLLLQNFKHPQQSFGLPLTERNVSCSPTNLPRGSGKALIYFMGTET